jgi:hypothetical protein
MQDMILGLKNPEVANLRAQQDKILCYGVEQNLAYCGTKLGILM